MTMIDFLWAHAYDHVYVIPPNVVKSTRGRHRQSGPRSDESDARLIADLLRTDLSRLHPWHPDSTLTQQIRTRDDLHTHLIHTMLRLWAVLLRYYPAALGIFSGLHTQIALQFS